MGDTETRRHFGLWGLIAAAVALILAWGVAEKGPTRWDDSWYLANAVRLFDRFAEEGLLGYWRGFEHALGDKAPLITVLPFPFFCLIGRSTFVIYLVNGVACVVFSVALYRFCRRFFDERTSLLAVFFALTSPLLLGLSRVFLVEYWLTAFAVCALLALAEWDHTRRLRCLLWLGAFCGLGLLTKITFPLFLGPVVAVVLLRGYGKRIPALAGAVVLIAIPAVILAGPWYYHNWEAVTRRSFQESYFAPTHAIERQSPAAMAVEYFFRIVNDGLSGPHVLAGTAGLTLWLLRKRDNFLGGALFYLVPLVVTLPVFLLSENREIRLIAPMIPAFVIAIAALVARLHRYAIRAVILLTAVLAIEASFARLGIPALRVGRWVAFSSTSDYAFPPNPQRWPLAEVIERIAQRERLGPGSKLIVGLGADTWSFNSNNLDLQAVLLKYPFEFYTSAYTSNPDLVRLVMSRTQYFLLKDGGTQQPLTRFEGGPITRDFLLHGPLFREVELGIMTPDGGRIRLFENASAGPDAFVSARQPPAFPDLPKADLNFGNYLQASGVRLTEKGGLFTLALRWRCLNRIPSAYRVFAHVVDPNGRLLGSMDHEILHGSPPVNDWQPGDEGYEARYLALPAAQAQGAQLRLGLFHPETRLRLPLWASTLPLKDDYTAVVVEPNQTPSFAYTFRMAPAPPVSCDVSFEDGLQLTGYSVRRDAGTVWLRLVWSVPTGPKSRLYFFGHAVVSHAADTPILMSFDQDIGLDRTPPPRDGSPLVVVQDIVRDVSKLGPEGKLIRAGVFDMDKPLDRLRIRSSSLPMSKRQKAIYLMLPPPQL